MMKNKNWAGECRHVIPTKLQYKNIPRTLEGISPTKYNDYKKKKKKKKKKEKNIVTKTEK